MKKILTISLILNAALVGYVAAIRLESRSGPSAQSALPSTLNAATTTASATNIISSAVIVATTPKNFQWNQLDAPDYHVYVKNLRTIGCPEATIRAIVTADVHAAFGVRSRFIKQKLTALASRSSFVLAVGQDTEDTLRHELEDMPDEENAMIANLLGLKTAPAPALASTSPAPDSIPLPLALQNIDPAEVDLTLDQQQAIASVRQDFLQEVGGSNQNPNDPAYLARWQKAQPVADAMLMATLGNDAYTRYQLAGYQAALKDRVMSGK